MRPYELAYLAASPLTPALYNIVRGEVRRAVAACDGRPAVLDVGGRRSPYTIGVSADVTVLDLPQEGGVQTDYDLGLSEAALSQIRTRRSNVVAVVLEDMVHTTLPDAVFDVAVAVEVLEHVEFDEAFVAQVARVLKPGGVFIMTTPNNDHYGGIVPPSPKDFRYYHRTQLAALLSAQFSRVTVRYAMPVGRNFSWALKPLNPKKPVKAAQSAVGRLLYNAQIRRQDVGEQARGTRTLLAIARKEAGNE